jgi:hypothetical protein
LFTAYTEWTDAQVHVYPLVETAFCEVRKLNRCRRFTLIKYSLDWLFSVHMFKSVEAASQAGSGGIVVMHMLVAG